MSLSGGHLFPHQDLPSGFADQRLPRRKRPPRLHPISEKVSHPPQKAQGHSLIHLQVQEA